jgi:hypothetical protein
LSHFGALSLKDFKKENKLTNKFLFKKSIGIPKKRNLMLNLNPLKKFHKSVKPKLKLCLTKKRAVAWTQSFLEPVYRGGG